MWDEAETRPSSQVGRKICEIVEEAPGIHLRAIARSAALSTSSTFKQVGWLRSAGVLQTHRDGRYTRYFPVGPWDSERDREMACALRSPVPCAVIMFLDERQSGTQLEMASHLHLGRGSLAPAVRRLRDRGLLLASGGRANRRYELADRSHAAAVISAIGFSQNHASSDMSFEEPA